MRWHPLKFVLGRQAVRPAHYLESLTDTYCPGRFAIKTEPIPLDLQPTFKKQRADEQAEMVVDYCEAIHDLGRTNLARAFALLIDELKTSDELSDAKGLREKIFFEIRNACYPYIHISAADIRNTLEQQQKQWIASPLVLAPRNHMTTLAEPNLLRKFYIEQCRNLLSHGYRLEAGLSIVPIPVTYAIEHSATAIVAARKTVLEAIQSFFPVPKLHEIEDSVVDGWYHRRDESTAVNREYTLHDSIFWEDYKRYLRSGKWSTDLGFPEPGSTAGLLRERLHQSRSKSVKPESVSVFDEAPTSFVAPREDVAPRQLPT